MIDKFGRYYSTLRKAIYLHRDEIAAILQQELNTIVNEIRSEQREYHRGNNYPYGYVRRETQDSYARIMNSIEKLNRFLEAYNFERDTYTLIKNESINSLDRYMDDPIYNYKYNNNSIWNQNNYNNNNNNNDEEINNNFGNAMRSMYGNNNA
jgi:hypothetical protein